MVEQQKIEQKQQKDKVEHPIMTISQDDVGKRVLIKKTASLALDAKWVGNWELFGLRYDGSLVLREIETGRILELPYDPDIIKVVGPTFSSS